MPNHYTSVCTVTGPAKVIDRFRRQHFVAEGEGTSFDFATVIPRPACVEGTESGSEADAGFFALTGMMSVHFARFSQPPWHHYTARGFTVSPLTGPQEFRDWLAINDPGVLEKGARALACFRETGHLSWYEWNRANWGTKWGSYQFSERSVEPGRCVFEFQTANGVPCPIFEELVRLHPELTIDVTTIDEGGPEYESRYSATENTLAKVEPTPERYRFVYGCDPDSEDEETVSP